MSYNSVEFFRWIDSESFNVLLNWSAFVIGTQYSLDDNWLSFYETFNSCGEPYFYAMVMTVYILAIILLSKSTWIEKRTLGLFHSDTRNRNRKKLGIIDLLYCEIAANQPIGTWDNAGNFSVITHNRKTLFYFDRYDATGLSILGLPKRTYRKTIVRIGELDHIGYSIGTYANQGSLSINAGVWYEIKKSKIITTNFDPIEYRGNRFYGPVNIDIQKYHLEAHTWHGTLL